MSVTRLPPRAGCGHSPPRLPFSGAARVAPQLRIPPRPSVGITSAHRGPRVAAKPVAEKAAGPQALSGAFHLLLFLLPGLFTIGQLRHLLVGGRHGGPCGANSSEQLPTGAERMVKVGRETGTKRKRIPSTHLVSTGPPSLRHRPTCAASGQQPRPACRRQRGRVG